MKKSEYISKKGYTPYSARSEFCLITGTSGMVYPGVRIENSSFPLTITAVQAAICSCLANRDQPKSLCHPNGKTGDETICDWWKRDFNIRISEEMPDEYSVYSPFLTSIDNIPEKLEKLCEVAVVKSSDFPVAAILETDRGIVSGVNIEFSEWQMGLCAERVAISRAISAGVRSFNTIHIYAPKSDFCSPCGACRQVLHEFMPQKKAVLYHSKTETTTHYVEHLLPHAFIAESLNNKYS